VSFERWPAVARADLTSSFEELKDTPFVPARLLRKVPHASDRQKPKAAAKAAAKAAKAAAKESAADESMDVSMTAADTSKISASADGLSKVSLCLQNDDED
jgi:predicted solute-binding protein